MHDIRCDIDAVVRDLRLRPPAPRQLHPQLVELIISNFCQIFLKIRSLDLVDGDSGKEEGETSGGLTAEIDVSMGKTSASHWIKSFVAMVSRVADIAQLLLER